MGDVMETESSRLAVHPIYQVREKEESRMTLKL